MPLLDIECRPMQPSDYGVVESVHLQSREEVQTFVGRQGIASMLVFAGLRYVHQLYLKEYDPQFHEPGASEDHRCWADGVARLDLTKMREDPAILRVILLS